MTIASPPPPRCPPLLPLQINFSGVWIRHRRHHCLKFGRFLQSKPSESERISVLRCTDGRQPLPRRKCQSLPFAAAASKCAAGVCRSGQPLRNASRRGHSVGCWLAGRFTSCNVRWASLKSLIHSLRQVRKARIKKAPASNRRRRRRKKLAFFHIRDHHITNLTDKF